jgi:hypothetical protein
MIFVQRDTSLITVGSTRALFAIINCLSFRPEVVGSLRAFFGFFVAFFAVVAWRTFPHSGEVDFTHTVVSSIALDTVGGTLGSWD